MPLIFLKMKNLLIDYLREINSIFHKNSLFNLNFPRRQLPWVSFRVHLVSFQNLNCYCVTHSKVADGRNPSGQQHSARSGSRRAHCQGSHTWCNHLLVATPAHSSLSPYMLTIPLKSCTSVLASAPVNYTHLFFRQTILSPFSL